jgi:putative membrane protein
MTTADPRRPRVFAPDDPALVIGKDEPKAGTGEAAALEPDEDAQSPRLPTTADVKQGFRWGAMLLSVMAGLTALAAGVAWTRFIGEALLRNDWVGWIASGLLGLLMLAALVIAGKEVGGLFRLARLGRLKKDIDAALREGDQKRERTAVAALKALFADRHDARWGLQRMSEHERDVHDPGALLRLADRELLAPLDVETRRVVMKAAKRVATVTAMSPMASLAMLYVVAENLRVLRTIATVYGGRPGFTGALRLARLVVGHIVATGGVAMTDDLLGQFLGQDLLRRLSRRLGEGLFNGALTARVGVAAIEVTRPLPFLDAPPIRVRDLLTELWKRKPA